MSRVRPVLSEHPLKVRVESFAPDGSLKAEDGWVNMNVKFLITRESVGASQTVFGITRSPRNRSKRSRNERLVSW